MVRASSWFRLLSGPLLMSVSRGPFCLLLRSEPAGEKQLARIVLGLAGEARHLISRTRAADGVEFSQRLDQRGIYLPIGAPTF